MSSRRIDLVEAGRAVARDPQRTAGVFLDPVWFCIWRLRGDKLDGAGRRIETADHVAQLKREPRNALPVEDERVWIFPHSTAFSGEACHRSSEAS